MEGGAGGPGGTQGERGPERGRRRWGGMGAGWATVWSLGTGSHGSVL